MFYYKFYIFQKNSVNLLSENQMKQFFTIKTKRKLLIHFIFSKYSNKVLFEPFWNFLWYLYIEIWIF